MVSDVTSSSVDVVVVVVVVESISVDVVIVVVVSTSVDVAVMNVVVVFVAGVTIEVVVEGPRFNKLLQNEVAGALRPDRIDRMSLTSLHTLLTIGLTGELRLKRRSPNGVARAGAALRNRRMKVTTVGRISNNGE
jgi:hypothetical protein